jgi:hypothetical protein
MKTKNDAIAGFNELPLFSPVVVVVEPSNVV